MEKYEILEHLADLKIRAFGKNKKELFLNMLKGMVDSQKPEIENKETKKRKIKIESIDLSNLLVDFLSEILYLSQINREAYQDFKFKNFSDKKVCGDLFGQKVKRFGEDIKAVTYYSLDIHQRRDKVWEATVLFDI